MTQLELFEDTSRLGIRRPGVLRAVLTFIAMFRARAAMARLEAERQASFAEIPDHLRRDLGLPDRDPGPWPLETIFTHMRLK